MYTPRGRGISELGDIEVVSHGDELHLFHLTLPNHDVVQHAVSHDGLTWTPLPAALRTGDPGAIDDDQIWTMSVTPRPNGDGYLMLYTALTTADDGRVQRVAAATSADLLHWRKSPANPVAAADPRWYEAEPGQTQIVSWRDPKITRVRGSYLATVCAREATGPLPRRGCVGLMLSDDLERWEVHPPLFAPHRYWDLECPQLFRLHDDLAPDRWYLTAAIMEDRTQRYWSADSVLGPYHVPPRGDLLAPPGHYAARVTHWRDRDMLFAWHQPKLAQGWMTSARTVDWVEANNPFGKFLAPPLELLKRPDGSLSLGSYPGWDAYRLREWQSPRPEAPLLGDESPHPNSAWGVASDGAMGLRTASPNAADFVLEGTLVLNAGKGGLALRLDEAGNGLYVELALDSRRVSLQHWGTTRHEQDGSHRHAYDELQCTERSEAVATGAAIPFRLLSVGPYLEVAFGGEVALATMTGVPGAGRWGIWVEDGSCLVDDVRWAPMRRPGDVSLSEDGKTEETASGG